MCTRRKGNNENRLMGRKGQWGGSEAKMFAGRATEARGQRSLDLCGWVFCLMFNGEEWWMRQQVPALGDNRWLKGTMSVDWEEKLSRDKNESHAGAKARQERLWEEKEFWRMTKLMSMNLLNGGGRKSCLEMWRSKVVLLCLRRS